MKIKAAPAAKPTTIDTYLASVSADQRAALEKLRQAIHRAASGLEEGISYGVPSFRLSGKYLFSFGATARHCAFYPGAVVQAYADELKAYDTSKGTIRFQPDKPLPLTLVKKLVQAQIARKQKF